VSSLRGLVCLKPEEQAVPRLERWLKAASELKRANGFNGGIVGQLDEYFAGSLRQFDVVLDVRGTDFQRQVWELLRTIPYGETRSYGELARKLGRPEASRAVGRANGTNPVSIIIPCHRVIGSNGTLVGYGGGLDRKQRCSSWKPASSDKRGKRRIVRNPSCTARFFTYSPSRLIHLN